MRVILVGPPARRRELRARLPAGIEIVAEQQTIARPQAGDADAFLVVADAFLARAATFDEESVVEQLTAREAQVLELLADGKPNKAIAARLGISDETVKFHLSTIFGKLGASNRTDAVRQAIRRGFVPL